MSTSIDQLRAIALRCLLELANSPPHYVRELGAMLDSMADVCAIGGPCDACRVTRACARLLRTIADTTEALELEQFTKPPAKC